MAMKIFLNETPRTVGKGRASRRQLRLPLHGSKATGAEIEALVHNISATGMLVESEAALDVGEEIEVNLPHSGKTAARVIWTSARLAGCQFDMPISPATLSAAQLRSVVVDADARPSPLRPRAIGSPRSGLPVYTLAPANALGMRESAVETRITRPIVPGKTSGKCGETPARAGNAALGARAAIAFERERRA